MLMYKHKTGMLPHIYNALFIPIITLHTHNTRQYTEYVSFAKQARDKIQSPEHVEQYRG